MLYLPSSNCSYCSNCSEDGCSGYWYWGSSGSLTSTHEHMAKNNTQHKHTCKQRLTLRNSTTIHENNKQNHGRTILRVTTIAWTKRTPKTELKRKISTKNKVQGPICKKTEVPGGFWVKPRTKT